MRNIKHLLALLLCVILCLALFPAEALAAVPEEAVLEEGEEGEIVPVEAEDLPPVAEINAEADYLAQCSTYTCYADLEMRSADTLWSLPCKTGTYSAAKALTTIPKGTKLVTTQLWKNTLGVYWYKVSYGCYSGYVFSGSVDSTAKWKITLSNITAPTGDRTKGKALTLTGVVNSENLKMTRIGAKIYRDTDLEMNYPLTGTEVSLNKNNYSIQGSPLDLECKLGSLDNGSYFYIIYCTVENHLADGSYLQTVTKTFKDYSRKELYVSRFTVGGATPTTNYAIEYNANGGTGAPSTQYKAHGVDLKLSTTTPTRADSSQGSYTVSLNPNGGSVSVTSLTAARYLKYSFKNWNTASGGAGVTYAPGDTYVADSAVVLYAQWNSTAATDAVTLPTPTRSGYSFKGWGTSATATTGVTGKYTPTGNVTLYAVWGTGAPAINTQPKDVSVNEGETAKFTVSATGTGLSYQWQWRKGSSGTWSNCTTAGSTTATLSVPGYSYRNGFQYRCKVSNSVGTTFSSSAKLTVFSTPVIVTQPSSVTASTGTIAKFTVVASGNYLTYQWQWRKGSSGTWADCTSTPGCETATLSVSAEASRSGFQYRCKVSNATGTVYSNSATLTVNGKPVITGQPKDLTVSEGENATFTVTASGSGLSYQWQWRKGSSGTWADCTSTPGCTTATITVDGILARDGYQYRCKVSNVHGSVYSNAAALKVNPTPMILVQPDDVTANAGETATFTVTASGSGLSYQWQWRKGNSGTWADCTNTPGRNDATLYVAAEAFRNGYQYRCKVTGSTGTEYTEAATLTVK